MKKLLLTGIGMALLTHSSTADAAYKVKSPYVAQGKVYVENYGSYSFDDADSKDGKLKHKVELGYGVTDFWKVGIEGIVQDAPGDAFEYYATEIVSKFQFWPKDSKWLDAGLYLAYEIHKDEEKADKVEAFLLLQKNIAAWSHRANIILEREVGEGANDELEGGLSWQTLYKLNDQWKVGGEYYAEFGELSDMPDYDDQVHLFGPVVKYDIKGIANVHADMVLGYLFGISDNAPDGVVKWELEFKF